MKEVNADILVEVRDIVAKIHDNHVGNGYSVSLIELAALRDCIARINRLLGDEAVSPIKTRKDKE